jgi:uncharacterized protein (UPF0332 family)
VSAPQLLEKARRALETAKRAMRDGDTETASDRAYYAVYYAAWALLDSRGAPRPKTHRGLIAEFSRLFVKDGPLDTSDGAVLSRLENLRLVADYTLEMVPESDAMRAVEEASRFITVAERLLD